MRKLYRNHIPIYWGISIFIFTFYLSIYDSIAQSRSKLKNGFIENRGQIVDQNGDLNPNVKYLLNVPNLNIQIKENGFSYDSYVLLDNYNQSNQDEEPLVPNGKIESMTKVRDFNRIDVEFVGSNPNAQIITSEVMPETFNYYSDKFAIESVNQFRKVTILNLYPGVNVDFVINEEGFKYNIIVAPGADPSLIKWRYLGSVNTSILDDEIHIITRHGKIKEEIPLSFLNSESNKIKVSYLSDKHGHFSFNIPDYNRTQTLIIDPKPIVGWSTYFGGTNDDNGGEVEVDNVGSIIVSGQVYSNNLATIGPFNNLAGNMDAIVSKFSSDGSNLLWSSYYGGTSTNSSEYSKSVRVDTANEIYITIKTVSAGLATMGQTSFGGGSDFMVVKFSSNGTRIWSTYLGGSGNEDLYAGETNKYGFTIVTGWSNSNGLATTGAYKTAKSGTYDMLVGCFDPSGNRLWSTYYGGNQNDVGYACAMDDSGNVYIGGYSQGNYPTSIVAGSVVHQSSSGGGSYDAVLVKFSYQGALLWGTYYGGNNTDLFYDIACDGDFVYASGNTASSNNIAINAIQGSRNGTRDGFLSKWTVNGQILWSTYFGGSGEENLTGLEICSDGGVIAVGYTSGTIATLVNSDSYKANSSGGNEGIIVKFDSSGKSIVWGTYFGGTGDDNLAEIVTDGKAQFYVIGTTNTAGLSSSGAYQNSTSGANDMILFSILDAEGMNNLATSNVLYNSSVVCLGSDTIKAEISNAGLNDVISFNLNWSIDGQNLTTVSISDTLKPGASKLYTLGTLSFSNRIAKNIVAYTSLPNGVSDTIRMNDTAFATFKPGFSGTYSIGGSGADFSTITEATDDLELTGVCGPTDIYIMAGSFTEKLELNSLNGISNSNKLQFIGSGTNNTVLSYASQGSEDAYVVSLKNISHVTIRNIELVNSGMVYGSGIFIEGDSNSLIDVNVKLDTNATGPNWKGIFVSGKENKLDSLYIMGGSYSVYFEGGESNSLQNSMIEKSTQVSVYIASGNANKLSANKILSKDVGLYSVNTNGVVITNNMIVSESSYCLFSDGVSGASIWHNSFSSDPSHSVVRFNNGNTISLINNHILNRSSLGTKYVLFSNDIGVFKDLDFNNYFAITPGNLAYAGVGYSNLPVWQASVSQFNQNSVNRDPNYFSPEDLHTNVNLPGFYVGVDEDIDGDFRNNVSPSIGADELNVPNNAGPSRLLSPQPIFCAGNQDVRVRIGNFGTNAIDSVRVAWSLNGTIQGVIYIQNTIPIKGYRDTTIGTISFNAGDQKDLKIWTSFPNGRNDSLKVNDTLQATVKTGLSGIYSIGGQNSDYQNFAHAIGEMQLVGLCGPVVFNVAPGTYNERIILPEINGASATNTITFKGSGVQSTTITYSSSGNSDWGSVYFDGGDHYSFRDLSVVNSNANIGTAVLLTNGANHNKLSNVLVSSSTTSTSINIAGIALISTPGDLYGAYGMPGDSNVFDSITVSGGYYGIYLNGTAYSNSVINSIFEDQYVGGIFFQGQNYPIISNNKVGQQRNVSFSYGINVSQSDNFIINGNKITSAGQYGLFVMFSNVFGKDPNFRSIISNNAISNTVGYAFYGDATESFSFVHNSLRSVGNSNSFEAACVLNGSTGVDFRNNIVRNDNPNSHALRADGGTFDSLDYNNYFSFGQFVDIGTSYSGLIDLQNGLPQFNQQSYSQDPQFYSLTDLHVYSYLPGTYVSIDEDMDKEPRCPQTVSIGADDDNWGFPTPIISTSNTNYFTNYPINFLNNLGSIPGIDYKWYINGVYYTDSNSFSLGLTTGINEVKLVAQRCIHIDSNSLLLNVLDGTPSITLLGFDPANSTVYTSYIDSGAIAIDFFGNPITNIQTGNNIDTSKLGSYYIWFTAEDGFGNKDSVVRTVNIIDDVNPLLTLNGADTISISVYESINDPGFVVSDNFYQGVQVVVDSSMVNKAKVGLYQMTYTATDSSNNVSIVTRWVKVGDFELPVIQLNGNDTIIVRVNNPYIELGAKVIDNYCGTNLPYQVDVYPNIYQLGDYTLTYTANDCEGNAALPVTRVVRVIDNISPLVILNGLPVIKVQRWSVFNDPGVTMSDNYYSNSELNDSLKITSDLDVNWIGEYTVCYQVTDPSGNVSNQVCRVIEVVENTTSIGAIDLNTIQIYPNPVYNTLTIDLGAYPNQDVRITIYDLVGKEHLSTNLADANIHKLDVSALEPGVYVVLVEVDNTQKTIKIQVK